MSRPASASTLGYRRHLWWAIAIAAAVVVARIWLLVVATHQPGFEWNIPDHYDQQANALLKGGHWHWTINAVRYAWGGSRDWVLPPLYPVFLSLFARDAHVDAFPAAVAQIVLGGLGLLAVYWLGLRLHSARAGLIATILSAGAAVMAPTNAFIQEQLYVPLLIAAFASLTHVIAKDSPSRAWFASGLVMALATLTRAMSLYMVPFIPLALFLTAGDRRRAGRQSAAYVAGFALLVLPYVGLISYATGQLVLIDNHGGIVQLTEQSKGTPAASDLASTISAIVRPLLSSPVEFLGSTKNRLSGQFRLTGGRSLQQVDAAAATPAGAWVKKVLVHAMVDLPWLLAAIGGPLGLAGARQRRAATIQAIWILLALALTVAALSAGPRYGMIFMPSFIVGVSCLLAGGWVKPPRAILMVSIAFSVIIAIAIVPSIAATLSARPQYGLGAWTPWRPQSVARSATGVGAAGFNVYSVDTVTTVQLEPTDAQTGVTARIWFEKQLYSEVLLSPVAPTIIRIPAPGSSMYFIEVDVRSPSGAPAPFRVTLITGP